MRLAGMPLRKINSNNLDVRKFITDKYGEVPPNQTKVLGILWNLITDTLTPDISSFVDIPIKEFYTKAEVLSVISKLFDPLGLFSPLTVVIKLLFQQLSVMKLKWDDVVPDGIYSKFVEWVKGFEEVQKSPHVKFPRFIGPECEESHLVYF